MDDQINSSLASSEVLGPRRWIRYGLWGLLILALISGLAAYQGYNWYYDMVDEEDAIAQLKANKVEILMCDDESPGYHSHCRSPDWFRRLVGKSGFQNAAIVSFPPVVTSYAKLHNAADGPRKDFETVSIGAGATDDMLRLVAKLKGLLKLDLSGKKYNDESFAILTPLTYLIGIEASQANINGTGLRYLRSLKNLMSLNLCQVHLSHEGFAALGDLQGLELCYLYGADCTDDDLRHIGRLTHLTSLNLAQTAVGDGGIQHLQHLSQLESLDLSSTRITDIGVAQLKPLSRLYYLNLDQTSVTGNTLTALQGAPLKSLSLRNSKVNDEGIAAILAFPTLELIDMTGVSMSMNAVRRLVALPRVISLSIEMTDPDESELKSLKKQMELKMPDQKFPHKILVVNGSLR